MSCLRNRKQRDSCFVQNKEKIFIPTNVSFHKSSGRMCVWDRAGGVIPAPKICLLVMGKLLEGRGSVPLSGLFTNQSAVDSLWMKKLSSLPTDVTHEWTPPPPTPSEGKSELRDTQLEEWEEVLPSPPMLSDSPSSRTNLSTGGVLSLDSPLTWRNIRKLTFIRPPAVSLLPAVYKCVCFLIFLIVLRESS